MDNYSKEVWKDVSGYEGEYQVSDYGRVRTIKTRNSLGRKMYPRTLKPRAVKHGYLRVALHHGSKSKDYLVHRLVAKEFVKNPHPRKFNMVNHKDDDVTNNHSGNLEWCDSKYNNNYFLTNMQRSKPVIQLTMDGNFVRIWASTKAAGRGEFLQPAVQKCCAHKSAYHYGYKWVYSSEYLKNHPLPYGKL